MEDLFFIGSVDDMSTEERMTLENKKSEEGGSNGQVKNRYTPTSHAELEEISQEVLDILNNTRIRNDYEHVYVRKEVDDWDSYYHSDPDFDFDQEKYKTLRQAKRLYRVQSEYFSAIDLYNEYMEYIEDKYSHISASIEELIDSGVITEWLPAMPMYSRTCPDYQKTMAGETTCSIYDDDDVHNGVNIEALEAYIDILDNDEGCTDEDGYGVMDIVTEPLLNPKAYVHFRESQKQRAASNTKKHTTLNVSDIYELQRSFDKFKETDDIDEEPFNIYDPESIEEYYRESSSIDLDDCLLSTREDLYWEDPGSFWDDEDFDKLVQGDNGRWIPLGHKRVIDYADYMAKNFGANPLKILSQFGINEDGNRASKRKSIMKKHELKSKYKKKDSFVEDTGSYVPLLSDQINSRIRYADERGALWDE